MDTLMQALNPLVQEILNLIVGLVLALVGAAAMAARSWLNAKAQATTSDWRVALLHRALQTGVEAFLAAKPDASPEEAAQAAIEHAEISVPDLLRTMAPEPAVLTNIALSKLTSARLFADVMAPK